MQISVKDAARMLDLEEEAIYRMIRQDGMPALLVNEEYRFNRAELLEWATGRGMKVSPGLFAEAEGDLPSLSEALAAGGVIRDLGGEDPEGVLRAMVDALRLPPDVDRDYLFEVMMAREGLGSTGIGEGIAIPHVRNPVVLHGTGACVSLCFLSKPAEFKAIDGKPVDILFAIVSPSVRLHLHLLSRLGSALRDEGFRKALRDRAEDGAIMDALAAAEAGMGRAGA